VWAGAYLVMAWTSSWVLAGLAFGLTGIAIGITSVVSSSMRQRLTPNELMGRVGAAWRGIVWGAAPVGALAAGTLALVGGLRLPLVLAGVLQGVMTLLLARPLLRNVRADADEDLHPRPQRLEPLALPLEEGKEGGQVTMSEQ
ncbi:MAG: hypothetical protein ACRD6W_00625, partial [Nitrososphaerales archaeon]